MNWGLRSLTRAECPRVGTQAEFALVVQLAPLYIFTAGES